MYKKSIFRQFFALTLAVAAHHAGAQELSDEPDRPLFTSSGILKKIIADNKFKNQNFEEALQYFESLREDDRDNVSLNYKIGLCHFSLHDYRRAVRFFEKVTESPDVEKPEAFYYLGLSQKNLFEFEPAIKNLKKYKEVVSTVRANSRETDKHLEQCRFGMDKVKKSTPYEVTNAGKKLNSKYADYSPVITPDGKVLIFTSRRETTTGAGKDGNDKKYFEDILISAFDEQNNDWTEPRSIGANINDNSHDASLSISPDGNILFLYKNLRGGDIYETRLDAEGNWLIPIPLPFGINTNSFESSASMTADGQTLVFVSERPGGFGKSDIYKATLNENGEWGAAENIGKMINTTEDEISCQISPDGNTLFFSSKGHKGMGGYDIFKSVRKNGIWSSPVNMGYPVNSPTDDLHFYLSRDLKSGWFSSLRNDNNQNMDIFHVNFLDEDPFEIKKALAEKKPGQSSGATARNQKKGQAGEQKTIVSGKVLEASGKAISAEIILNNSSSTPHFITDEKGQFTVSQSNTDMSFANVQALKTGYQAIGSQELSVSENKASKATEMHFTLKLKEVSKDSVLKLNRYVKAHPQMIVFPNASSTLPLDNGRNDKLDKLVEILKLNRKMRVVLNGHTDLTGTPLFNKQISLSRAYAVSAYLQSKGIPLKKIKVNGLGTNQSLATNETEEGREVNRRVELIIK